MLIYVHKCAVCGKVSEQPREWEHRNDPAPCCGEEMTFVSMRTPAQQNEPTGKRPDWVTESLGIAPCDNVREFEAKYSEFGVKVLNTNTGAVSVPFHKQEAYAQARGRTRDIDRRFHNA
jgi:hypothetical protein